MLFKNVIAGALVLGMGAFVMPQQTYASTFSAYESIDDIYPLDAIQRDLERTRHTSQPYDQVESNDATIVAQNNVSPQFGLWIPHLGGLGDVTYQHNMNWVIPPASTWLSAVLTIKAWGPDNNNDGVIVDTVNVGTLVSELAPCATGPIDCGFTTTVFNNVGDPVLLSGLIADGILNVTINKTGPLDEISIYGSRLDVTYSTVPEPVTMLLLGPALGYCAIRRRQRT